MRLAVISDIHGNLPAFEAVLNDLDSVGEVDLIWCLGDLAIGGTRPAECVNRVQELQEKYGKDKFKVVGGNTDRYLVTGTRPILSAAKDAEAMAQRKKSYKQRDDVFNWTLDQLSWENYEFIASILGRELRQHVSDFGDVIGFHAIPGDDDQVSLRPDSPEEEAQDALLDRAGRLALAGHTHLVMDRQLGGWRVVNPGSVGFSFTDIQYAEWALITFDDATANVDFRKAPFSIQTMLDDRQAVGYPHPDWIYGFIRN